MRLIILLSIFASLNVSAGQWLPDTGIQQIEARDGSYFSVVLDNTDELCPSNRVVFRNGQYTNQEGVNHHYSIVLAATLADKNVSIHVENDTGECVGRISYIKP